MLSRVAYEEYADLVFKHHGFKPRVEDIQPQADALIRVLQDLLAKNKKIGNNKNE